MIARITPYGRSGPRALHRADDLAVGAAGGAVSVNGDPDRPPVRIGAPQYFQHAAAEAALHLVVGLRAARRTGTGREIDVAAQLTAVPTLMNAAQFPAVGQPAPVRASFGTATPRSPLRSLFRAADGHVVATIAFGPGVAGFLQWLAESDEPIPEVLSSLPPERRTAAEVTGRPELAAALDAAAVRFFASRSKRVLGDEAVRHRVMLVPVNRMSDVLEDEQLAARGYFQPVDHGGDRTWWYPTTWVGFSRTPLVSTPRAPHVDEHADAVLGAGR